MRKLTEDERTALLEVAAMLGVRPALLAAEIEFESGWNPQAKNPTSSARGLIQFMRSTAMRMPCVHDVDRDGDRDSIDLVREYPTIEAQLRGPVLAYLMPMAPFRDEAPCLEGQSLFLAVFFPRYRKLHPDTPFPPHVQAANRGIKTPRDYVAHVWRRVGSIEF